jgi:hypothetical protein
MELASSIENIALLAILDPNPPVFRGKSSLVVPPLVLNSILEANTLFPASLIPIFSIKFQEFDHASVQNKDSTPLCPVLEFLWAVYKKIVPPLVVAADSRNDGLDCRLVCLIALCLHFTKTRSHIAASISNPPSR